MYKHLAKKLFGSSFKRHYIWFFNKNRIGSAPPPPEGNTIITENGDVMVDESGFNIIVTQLG